MRPTIAFAAIVCLSLGLIAPMSAIAPPMQPAPMYDIVGEWEILWGRTPCEMAFRDGNYYCLWMGVDYLGTYKLDGATLTVRERVDPASDWPHWWTWTVDLRTGQVSGDYSGTFAFGKRLGKVH